MTVDPIHYLIRESDALVKACTKSALAEDENGATFGAFDELVTALDPDHEGDGNLCTGCKDRFFAGEAAKWPLPVFKHVPESETHQYALTLKNDVAFKAKSSLPLATRLAEALSKDEIDAHLKDEVELRTSFQPKSMMSNVSKRGVVTLTNLVLGDTDVVVQHADNGLLDAADLREFIQTRVPTLPSLKAGAKVSFKGRYSGGVAAEGQRRGGSWTFCIAMTGPGASSPPAV